MVELDPSLLRATAQEQVIGATWETGWVRTRLKPKQTEPLPRRKDFPGIILPPGGEMQKPNWFSRILERGS